MEAVQLIESKARRLEVLTEAGGPAVYVDIGLESLVPLAVCGEGFVRLFSLAVELTSCRHGVLLVDEIDNGLHHSVMRRIWEHLRVLCRKHDVQIIATTHNEELVDNALEEFNTAGEPIGLFRIDRNADGHLVASYDEEAQQPSRKRLK